MVSKTKKTLTTQTVIPLPIPAVKSWKFGEIESIPNSKNRFVPITVNGTNLILPFEQVYNPFGPSEYDTETRKTLVSQLQTDWTSPLECMTECLIFEVAEKSGFLFGTSMDRDQISGMYKNIVRQKENFPSSIAAKMQLTGYSKTKFWDASKARIEAPSDFQGINYNVMVHIKGLYLTPDSWGLIANVADCQILSNSASCPF